MIIDAHLHVFLSASQDPERTVDHIASAERSAPVEMLEREMASAGVDRAVLAPLGPEDTYISDLLAANPNRFAGIAVAEPGQYDPAQVADRLDLGGFKGLRMFALPGEWDEAPWRGLLQRLEQDGRVLWLYPRAEDLANVATIAAQLDGFRIVLNHCGLTQAGIGLGDKGRPRLETPIPQPTESAILALSSFENVFVILSGAYGFSHLASLQTIPPWECQLDLGSPWVWWRLFLLVSNWQFGAPFGMIDVFVFDRGDVIEISV